MVIGSRHRRDEGKMKETTMRETSSGHLLLEAESGNAQARIIPELIDWRAGRRSARLSIAAQSARGKVSAPRKEHRSIGSEEEIDNESKFRPRR